MWMLWICYQRILNLKHNFYDFISIFPTFSYFRNTKEWGSIHFQAKKTGNVHKYFGSYKGHQLWEALQLLDGHLGNYWLNIFPHERKHKCQVKWFSTSEARAPHIVWKKWQVWRFYYVTVYDYVNKTDVHDILVKLKEIYSHFHVIQVDLLCFTSFAAGSSLDAGLHHGWKLKYPRVMARLDKRMIVTDGKMKNILSNSLFRIVSFWVICSHFVFKLTSCY